MFHLQERKLDFRKKDSLRTATDYSITAEARKRIFIITVVGGLPYGLKSSLLHSQ